MVDAGEVPGAEERRRVDAGHAEFGGDFAVAGAVGGAERERVPGGEPEQVQLVERAPAGDLGEAVVPDHGGGVEFGDVFGAAGEALDPVGFEPAGDDDVAQVEADQAGFDR